MMTRSRSISLNLVVLILLWMVRVLCALFTTAYIHPDEWFQAVEPMVCRVFPALSTCTLTWEFTTTHPIRSVVTPMITSGIPLYILSCFISNPSGYHIFFLSRFVMLLLSFLLDYIMCVLVRGYPPTNRWTCQFALASSWTILCMQTKPFSNSIEAIYCALALVLALTPSVSISITMRLILFAIVSSLGIFCRITFPAFVLPFGIHLIYNVYHEQQAAARRKKKAQSSRRSRLASLMIILSLLVVPFLVVSFCHIVLDSLFYSRLVFYAADGTSITMSNAARVLLDSSNYPLSWQGGSLVITPINNLRYNSNASNLAQHGLHPPFLHSLVNMPLLFGPGYLVVFLAMSRWRHLDPLNYLSVSCILFSLAILSVFPHQEPRFLLPLITPITVLVGTVGYNRLHQHHQFEERGGRLSIRRWLLVSWILFHVILTGLLGCFHQSGVVRVLLYLSFSLPFLVAENHANRVQVTFLQTYMPPPALAFSRHPEHPVDIRELQNGMPMISSDAQLLQLLVAPASVLVNQSEYHLLRSFWGHLALDEPEKVSSNFILNMSMAKPQTASVSARGDWTVE